MLANSFRLSLEHLGHIACGMALTKVPAPDESRIKDRNGCLMRAPGRRSLSTVNAHLINRHRRDMLGNLFFLNHHFRQATTVTTTATAKLTNSNRCDLEYSINSPAEVTNESTMPGRSTSPINCQALMVLSNVGLPLTNTQHASAKLAIVQKAATPLINLTLMQLGVASL